MIELCAERPTLSLPQVIDCVFDARGVFVVLYATMAAELCLQTSSVSYRSLSSTSQLALDKGLKLKELVTIENL